MENNIFIQFLENYPLYRKLTFNLQDKYAVLPFVSVNLLCTECNEIRTFATMERILITDETTYPYYEINLLISTLKVGNIIYLNYQCMSCHHSRRTYFIIINNDQSMEKIGQHPEWFIPIKSNLRRILGDYQSIYRKGLISESFGYGIGAFAYYRIIIEEIIDKLLEIVPDLMSGEQKTNYEAALEQTKNSKNAKEKIALIKDLLPSLLLTQQYNPLKTLYDLLSEGIHQRNDEECLEDAETIRKILIFLVDVLFNNKQKQHEFTEGMEKLLEKKRETINKKKKI